MSSTNPAPSPLPLWLALLSLLAVGWMGWPAPAGTSSPTFVEVCDPLDGTPCLELTSLAAGADWSRDVALGDLDGNGTIDAVVVQGSGSGPQSNVIWLGDSGEDCPNPFDFDPNFCEGDLVGGGDSRGVALEDLDGDDDLDIFVANGGLANNDDEVWLNQGGAQSGPAGSFSLTQVITNGASEAVALADLNGDTFPDAVVAGATQRVFWNLGNGTFDVTSPTVVANNTPVYDVAVADLDGDTRPDIVLAGEGGSPFSDATQVFWNESSGPMSAVLTAGPILSTSLGSNTGLGVGRLNNDVYPDVFIASSGPNKVWLSNGDRTFTAGADLGNDNDTNVALADFEGDGDLDAFVTRLAGFPSPNGIWINDGSGGFSAGVDSLGIGSSYAVALDDLDGDGDPDAFVANSGPNKVYRNESEDPVPTGFFVSSGQEIGDESLDSVALGDLDGDGDLDAVVTGFLDSRVWVNQGGDQGGNEGDFLEGQALAERDAVALGDVDGDTDLDLVLVQSVDPALLYLNQGGIQGGTPGLFSNSGEDLGGNYRAVEMGDVDGDNDLDVVLLTGDWNGRLLINQGGDQGGTPGTFQDSGQAFPDLYAREVHLHDLDGDTDLDLFFSDTARAIWLNTGLSSGLFVADADLELFVYKGGFGDLDGDSDADLFAINDVDSRVYVNQGGTQGGVSGTFADSGQSLGMGYQDDVEVGDLTGDGSLDVLAMGYFNVNVWHNDGTGTLNLAQTFSGDNGIGAALGDLDGDGDLDAFIVTPIGGRVWLNGENGLAPAVTLGTSTIRGASGQHYLHWWPTGNARLPLHLTHPDTEIQSLDVEVAYEIRDAGDILIASDSDTDSIDFGIGETLKLATAFQGEPGGAAGEVWNPYQGTIPIDSENLPMDVALTLQSPNLSLIGPDTFRILFHSPNSLVRNCFLEGFELMLDLAGIGASSAVASSGLRAAKASSGTLDLDLFRDLRDNVLATSPQGRFYTDLYTAHSTELLQVAAGDPGLLLDTLQVVLAWTPAFRALVAGQGDTATIDAAMTKDLESLLRAYKARASAELRAAIETEEAALDLPSFIGLEMDQALQKVEEREVVDPQVFADGFGSGDTTAWSRTRPSP